MFLHLLLLRFYSSSHIDFSEYNKVLLEGQKNWIFQLNTSASTGPDLQTLCTAGNNKLPYLIIISLVSGPTHAAIAGGRAPEAGGG